MKTRASPVGRRLSACDSLAVVTLMEPPRFLLDCDQSIGARLEKVKQWFAAVHHTQVGAPVCIAHGFQGELLQFQNAQDDRNASVRPSTRRLADRMVPESLSNTKARGARVATRFLHCGGIAAAITGAAAAAAAYRGHPLPRGHRHAPVRPRRLPCAPLRWRPCVPRQTEFSERAPAACGFVARRC